MKAGEVWEVNFSPQIGDEIQKIRPAVIVSNDAIGALDLKVVVPVTDGLRVPREWHVALHPTGNNGLTKESLADCFQVKSISRRRFVRKIGVLDQSEMEMVKLGLVKVLDLL